MTVKNSETSSLEICLGLLLKTAIFLSRNMFSLTFKIVNFFLGSMFRPIFSICCLVWT